MNRKESGLFYFPFNFLLLDKSASAKWLFSPKEIKWGNKIEVVTGMNISFFVITRTFIGKLILGVSSLVTELF